MRSSVITSVWVRGWALSRDTPAPVSRPWGYRIDVGSPSHVFRHVLPEPDGPTVRALCEDVTTPHAWLKMLAPPEDVARWITPDWTLPDDPGFMMYTRLHPSPAPALPDGYGLRSDTRGGVVRVRIHAPDGSLAARGQIAVTGADAVVDQVETFPGHQRRGLGTAVMRALETAGAAAGATRGVLSGTTDGRALYSALGWRCQGPLTGVYRTPAEAPAPTNAPPLTPAA
ncbi:GNAT family N-acetyltransferase [Streptomyces sp. MUM 203J]|uniref:GNAT family N-acetyltransferase n=1 Tax=Streptomyces sp. MUM 203J TaxID=2791990 RepID=UPI001F03CBD3|nr:GNAT family N-acetyltransferase [Streptomyces sp. MUM 203J]MCH0538237.1 GNAT family N-acetyltransferase [Streptomyces sp. MUM 203J]